jgi:TatD DNase family protein
MGRKMFIDAHSHLDRYSEDLEQSLYEINKHKIFTISNSMDLQSYERNLEIAVKSGFILPTFGVHPWNASEYINRLKDIDDAIAQSPMLGEIGLDYFFIKDTSQYPAQRKVFEFLLASANKLNKIVNLHTKGAEKEVLAILRNHNIQRAIIHWYSGPQDILKAMVNQGFYFTIGVEVLYSQYIRDIVAYLPAELLLTETDNPGGKRSFTETVGYPLLIRDITQKVADIKKLTIKATADMVRNNLTRLFLNDSWVSESYIKLIEENSLERNK